MQLVYMYTINAIGLHCKQIYCIQFHKHGLLSLFLSVWLAYWERSRKRLNGACQLKQNIYELYVIFITLFSKLV